MPQNVDLSKFNAAIRQLSALSGTDFRKVMVTRTGAVLSTAIRYTRKADVRKIKEQVSKHTLIQFEKNQSDVGKLVQVGSETFFAPGPDFAKWFFISAGWHVPDDVWKKYQRVLEQRLEDYQATVDRKLATALARRGLTAKTWLQIAEAIGTKATAPGYVEKASIPPAIGTGRVIADDKQCTIEGEDASNVLNVTGGQGIIDRAIASQAKYIEIAIEKGALDSLKSRARAFPDLFREGRT